LFLASVSEIIQADYPKAFGEKANGKIGTDESGNAGDEDGHKIKS